MDMRSYQSFRKGNIVRVINESSPLYDEIWEVQSMETPPYFVKLASGQGSLVFRQDLVYWLGYIKMKRNYTKPRWQMQTLSVHLGDKQFFYELGYSEIRKINNEMDRFEKDSLWIW